MLPIGTHVPDFAIQLDNGEMFRLRDVRGRSFLVIVFLPTDFASSKLESAYFYLQQLQKIHNSGANVLTISPQPLIEVKKLFSLYSYPFLIAHDSTLQISRMFQVVWLRGLAIRSIAYMIDKKGIIVGRTNHHLLTNKSWNQFHNILKEHDENNH